MQHFVHVARVALRHQELARRNVQQRQAELVVLAEMHRRQVVVAPPVQHVVVERHAGRYQLGDTALDDALGLGGVFELVADGDALARPHQLGQIGIQ